MQNLITSSQLKRMSLLLQVTDNLCSDVVVHRQTIYQQHFPWWFWGSNDDDPCQNLLFQQNLLKFSNFVLLPTFIDWYSVRKSFPSSAGTALETGSHSSLSLNYRFFKSQESPAVMTYDLVLHSYDHCFRFSDYPRFGQLETFRQPFCPLSFLSNLWALNGLLTKLSPVHLALSIPQVWEEPFLQESLALFLQAAFRNQIWAMGMLSATGHTWQVG